MTTFNPDTLADRIRSEAAQAARPGQTERLEAIADEVEKLRRGAKTLGETIDQQCCMILDITGLHDWIDEDGDGDWGAVWERAYELLPRARKAEAIASRVNVDDLARVIWETSRADEGTISAAGAQSVARAVVTALVDAPAEDETTNPTTAHLDAGRGNERTTE